MLTAWFQALGGDAETSSRLLDDVRSRPGHVMGAIPLPGRVTPPETRDAAAALTAVYGAVRVASACGPTGTWRLAPEDAEGSVLIVGSLDGRLRLRRAETSTFLLPGEVSIMTDDRGVSLEGVDHGGAALIVLVPASRLRTSHRELILRGPLPVPDSAHLRAAVAYVCTLLVTTVGDDTVSVGENGDGLVSLVGSLVEQALTVAGRSSRNSEVRQAALRCIDRHHRVQAFGVDDIARELFISRRQLYRAFPDAGGIAGMIAQRRLQTAERIMVDRPTLQLSEVAALSGFSTAGVMRAHFRRAYGTTPQRHRDAAHRPDPEPPRAVTASIPID
ncbi:MAG: helix-turn-helix transcriptional regulator [Microbacterium sp.]